MNLIQSIKKFFRKGAVTIGVAKELQTVLDHPKISMDPSEYRRIQQSFMYYRGEHPKIRFKNSNQKHVERDISAINMQKIVASEYAKVVFNEQCEIKVDGAASEFIGKVFEHNDFKKNLSKYLEPMFALGGLACRPYLDRNTNQVEFSWALADAFYPLESNTNNISEGAMSFTTTRTEGKKMIYYTHLEFHEWKNGIYFITNELYRSEKSNVVGIQVPLFELYEDLEAETTIQGLERPMFAYLKPSEFNNINPYSPLGLGVCDNCRNTLDRINRTYDEFDQEIRRGKRRIAASEMLLKSRSNEIDGTIEQFFDDDEDVFQIVPYSSMDDYKIQDLTSDIRTKEYIDAINHHLKTLEMETKLSSGTFTFGMNGVRSTKTATEVISENSQTFQTRSMQVIEVEKFIKELVISVCELGKALGIYEGDIPQSKDIGVSFDDGAFSSQEGKLEFYQKLTGMGYPVNKAFEAILKLPKNEAMLLYQEGLRQQATRTTGIFEGMGVGEEGE